MAKINRAAFTRGRGPVFGQEAIYADPRVQMAQRMVLDKPNRPIHTVGGGLAQMGEQWTNALALTLAENRARQEQEERAEKLAKSLVGPMPTPAGQGPRAGNVDAQKAYAERLRQYKEGLQSRAIPVELAQQAIARRMHPELYQPDPLRGKDRFVIGRNGEIIDLGPRGQSPNVVREGRDPNLLSPEALEQKLKIQRERGPLSTTKVQMAPEEKEEQKIVGGWFGKKFINYQETYDKARKRAENMRRIDELMENAYAGKGAETVLEIKRIGQALGLPIDLPENIGGVEAAQALANQLALQFRNPAGGEGMPGHLSDRDLIFLQSITPNMFKTPAGRKQIVETAELLAKRAREEARLAREYRKKHGQLDSRFFDQLDQYAQTHPLFTSKTTESPAPSGVDTSTMTASQLRKALRDGTITGKQFDTELDRRLGPNE